MSQPEVAPEPAPAPVSRIVITFPAPGSADATIRLEHVSPGQTMAAAWLLDTFAHELRDSQLPGLRGGLVIPTQPLPPGGPRA